MKKQEGMLQGDFLRQIEQGRLRGAYLLHGEEENLKQEALKALRAKLLPEGLEELNESILTAPEDQAIIAAAETLPFMADQRLVLVRDMAALTGRSEAGEPLLQYLAFVPDSAVIVFYVVGKADLRKKLAATLKKHGSIVTFDRLGPADLNRWITDRFAEQGKTCPPRCASALAFTAGADTATLSTEIAKICGWCGDRGEVTEDDIQRVATRSTECTVFNMVDALMDGRRNDAFRMMQDMLRTGSDELGILAMLLRQFRLMQMYLIMKYEKKPQQEMAGALGIAPFALDRLIRQCGRYTGREVKQAVTLCLDTEYAVKSGRMPANGSLEAVMLKLFNLKSPSA